MQLRGGVLVLSEDYIILNDGVLKVEEKTFRFDSAQGLKRFPAEDVRSINFYSGGEITTGALKLASERGIPINFFGYYGNYLGTYWPGEKLLSGDLTVEQVKLYLDGERRLEASLLLMKGVLDNMKSFLGKYGNDLSWAQIDEKVRNVEELMLEEARVRKRYYEELDRILPEEFSIVERTRRPPLNMGNALISFGNSRLYAEIVTESHYTSLNPTISFYHSPSERRFSLPLDISEVFKIPYVDRFIVKVVKQEIIKPTSQFFSEEGEGILLSDFGRKTFLKEWEKWMNFEHYHQRLKRVVSHREMIRLELYKFIKHIYGIEKYSPYVMGSE
jgi:CRISPR-associated protein Cas1